MYMVHFNNKGSSACKANSIKAYEAEEIVLNRVLEFLKDSERFINSIEAINKDTIFTNIQLKDELEDIESQLNETNLNQEKYMEAFEHNSLPIAILQERLQKVSHQKAELEQRRSGLSIQLNSEDLKVIQPEIIKSLIEKFLDVFKESSRD